MCSPLVSRKGNQEYGPTGVRLFYSTKLQVNLTWWKTPQNFASKKVLRWIEHGVKVEFQRVLHFGAETFGAEM